MILVRRETNPDDLPGMIAAEGILTSRGGKTSHAAVVARGMGKTCVSGADDLEIDVRRQDGHHQGRYDASARATSSRSTAPPARSTSARSPSCPARSCSTSRARSTPIADPLVAAVDRIIRHADGKRRLGVRTNADTDEDAARARRFGAEGIGLCRTEHMFLGERRKHVERLILAEGEDEQQAALEASAAAAARGLRRHLRRRWTGCPSRSG